MSPNSPIFQKFSGGACPRCPLARLRAFGPRVRTFGASTRSHQSQIQCPETKHYLSIYLSTNTATPPRGDYVQVSGVLQTGRQCSES